MGDDTATTVKPGIKTTEFWVILLVTICGLLPSAGIFKTDSIVLKVAGLIVSVISALGYGFFRTGVKNAAQILVLALLPMLALAGCGGLSAKTAKDIDTASSFILPEYLIYVDSDPKLDQAAKDRRHRQVMALQNVIQEAQK